MAKTIKFNLICDNTPVRTIEDLQNNFSIEDVLDYYRNGLYCLFCADHCLSNVLVCQKLLRQAVTAGNCIYA